MSHGNPKEPSGLDKSYFEQEEGLLTWIFSTDHKRIAVMQFFGMLIVAFVLALSVVKSASFDASEMGAPRALVEGLSRAFSADGAVVSFLLLLPGIPATLGVFLLPLQLGATNVAFPRLLLASFQLWLVGAVCLLLALQLHGTDSDLTRLLTLSSSSPGASGLVAGVAFVCASALLRALVLLPTIHFQRKEGLRWSKTPPLLWSLYAHSVVVLIAAPVVLLTLLMFKAEEVFGLGFFDPTLGGDPLLLQNFFWFGTHALIGVSVLPALGVISEVLRALSHRRLAPSRSLLVGFVGLSAITLLSWGLRSPGGGHAVLTLAFFSFFSLLGLVFGAQILGSWLRWLSRGARWNASLLLALGALSTFLFGGLLTLPLSALNTALHLHGTRFETGQSQLLLGSVALALLSGLHLWWPQLSGAEYSERGAKWAAGVTILGVFGSALPQLLLGAAGLTPKMFSATGPQHLLFLVSYAGMLLLAAGVLSLGLNLYRSLGRSPAPSRNPFNAEGLEWTCASPPPADNFSRLSQG